MSESDHDVNGPGNGVHCPPAERTVAGPPSPARRRTSLHRLWPIGAIILAMVAFYAAGLHRAVSLDSIIRNHERLGEAVEAHLALAIGAYVTIYVVAVALSFPGASFITILGGFLFGAIGGTTVTVFAATAGASIIFMAARSSLGGVLREKAGRFARRFADGFNENAFNYLLFLRLVPLFPFWLINIAPAMFDVPLRIYVAATAIGIIPGTLAYALLGDGLGGLIAAQERANPGCSAAGTCEIDLGALLTPGILVAIAGLALVALIPVALKRWRGERPAR